MMKQEVCVAMTVTVVVQATFGGEGDVGGCADEGDDEGGDCGAGEAEGEDAWYGYGVNEGDREAVSDDVGAVESPHAYVKVNVQLSLKAYVAVVKAASVR